MTTTTHVPDPRATVVRAVGIAVAVVTGAALLLGLLAGALGTTSDGAPAAAAPTASASPDAPASPEPIGPTAVPLPSAGDPVTPAQPPTTASHTVAAGETLAGLAQQYRVPTELIAADNGITDPDRIGTGESLAIPAPPTDVVVITDGATLSGYAAQYGTSVADLMALNPQITDADRILAGAGLRIAAG